MGAGLSTTAKARGHVHRTLRAPRHLLTLPILLAERSDKHFVALPKYSTRREIGRKLAWPSYDDRGMLTMLLSPGEMTKPQSFEHPRNREGKTTWHLNVPGFPDESKQRARTLADDIVAALGSLRVFYYKP